MAFSPQPSTSPSHSAYPPSTSQSSPAPSTPSTSLAPPPPQMAYSSPPSQTPFAYHLPHPANGNASSGWNRAGSTGSCTTGFAGRSGCAGRRTGDTSWRADSAFSGVRIDARDGQYCFGGPKCVNLCDSQAKPSRQLCFSLCHHKSGRHHANMELVAVPE